MIDGRKELRNLDEFYTKSFCLHITQKRKNREPVFGGIRSCGFSDFMFVQIKKKSYASRPVFYEIGHTMQVKNCFDNV